MKRLNESASIKDVARLSGVSTATVSLVINNSDRLIRPETRERVLQVVRDLQYRPSRGARGARTQLSNTIAVISGHVEGTFFTQPYFFDIYIGIVEAAEKQGQSVLLLHENAWANHIGELRQQLDGRCDGVVRIGAYTSEPVVAALKARGFPFVITGEGVTDTDISLIDVDNHHGAYTMTRFLLEQGHRQIALIMGEGLYSFDQKRQDGYRDALTDFGVSYEPMLVQQTAPQEPSFPSGYGRAGGYGRCRELLARRGEYPFTAIFCANDNMAFGAMDALKETGLRIPEEISIAGLDDSIHAESVVPALTTYRQPHQRIGAAAIEQLLKEIQGEPAGNRIAIPGELIIRDSVCPPEGG